MQEPRLTEVTLLYARGKNLSTDEFGWRLKRRHLAEGEYAVIPSRPGAPESRAASRLRVLLVRILIMPC